MNIRLLSVLAAALALVGAAAPKGDAAFVKAALNGNNQEIAHAALQSNSVDTTVRAFAERASTDHQYANQQLIAAANKDGFDTSGAISQPQMQTTPNAVGRPNAPQNGRMISAVAYFKSEIQAHRQSIALYKQEAAHGQHANLRAYARQQLPLLEKHLQMAQAGLRRESASHK